MVSMIDIELKEVSNFSTLPFGYFPIFKLKAG